MDSSNPKPREAEWLQHKALIQRLYFVDEKPLASLIDELGSLGFTVTTSQLEYKLRKWNYKRKIDRQTWVYIDHRITKRTKEGKDSEVIYCGKRLKMQTVKKETNRYRDTSIFAQLARQRTSSPVLVCDAQVAVCTPQPFSIDSEWPPTLPWLRFPAKALRTMLHAYTPANLDEPIWSKELISTIIHPGNLQWAKNSQLGVSKLAAIIGTAMPESYSGEYLQRAESLLHRSAEDFLHEFLSMLIYSLSNNAVDFDHDCNYNSNRWKTTMAMLKMCGIMNTKFDVKKLNSVTINGFMEKLFQATTKSLYVAGDVEYEEITALLTWILASGYVPTIHSSVRWGFFGPNKLGRSAQASVGEIKLRLMRHLLAIGIDANSILYDGALEAIISSNGSSSVVFRMVDLLLDHGASLNLDEALHWAIKTRDMDRVDMIVRRGGNLRTEFEHPNGFRDKSTALSVAAATGLSETKHIISCLVAQNSLEPTANFVTASAFISAALKGEDDTLQFLYSINSSVPTAHEYGITPLHAAAAKGHLTTCKLLYPLYGTQVSDIEPIFSPLHAACHGCHREVIEFLIAEGADVNAATKFGSLLSNQSFLSMRQGNIRSDSTPLCLALESRSNTVWKDHMASCALLIRSGARLMGYEVAVAAFSLNLELASTALEAGGDPNEKHPNYCLSPLQMALKSSISNQDSLTSRFLIVSLLLQKGAKLLGGEVISAIRLQDWNVVDLLLSYGGSLPDTDECGTAALEQAILSHDTAGINLLFETIPGIYDAGALCAAIKNQEYLIIQQLLVNRGTNRIADELETTAIGMAAKLGNLDLLRTLLKYPLPFKSGPMPFRMRYGPFGLIRKESTVREGQRGSPLALIAGQKGDKPIEACFELLKSGFQPDGLTWATIAYFDDLVLAQFLLDHHQPYNYNSPDQHKTQSPLVEAAGNHNKELAILFLKAGADANESAEQSGYPRSALQQAAEVGNLDIVCCLVEAGADVNSLIGDERATALQLAAIQGYLGIAKYLLDHGAQVNALPAKEYGRTALEGAAENGRLDMLEFLLASGALTTGKWRRRFVRAVKMATEEGHYTAAKLLKEAAGWSEDDENMFKTEDVDDEDTPATEFEEDGVDVDESDVGKRAADGIDVSEEYDYSWAVQGGDYIIGASYDFPTM